MNVRDLMHSLYEYAKNHGITHEKLAENLDVSVSAVSRWLRYDKTAPSLIRLTEMLDVMGLDIVIIEKKTGEEIYQEKTWSGSEKAEIIRDLRAILRKLTR